MYQVGDTLKIQVYLPDISYTSEMTISYLEGDILITCGHCLPENSALSFGKIIYTSGFDNEREGDEMGLVKIDLNSISLFTNLLDNKPIRLNNKILRDDTKLYLVNNGLKIPGRVLSYVNRPLAPGPINRHGWNINHQINKLSEPYLLAYGINKNTDKEIETRLIKEVVQIFKVVPEQFHNIYTYQISLPSFSGSPWLQKSGKYWRHVGIHIGKTIGYRILNGDLHISDIAYLKPII